MGSQRDSKENRSLRKLPNTGNQPAPSESQKTSGMPRIPRVREDDNLQDPSILGNVGGARIIHSEQPRSGPTNEKDPGAIADLLELYLAALGNRQPAGDPGDLGNLDDADQFGSAWALPELEILREQGLGRPARRFKSAARRIGLYSCHRR